MKKVLALVLAVIMVCTMAMAVNVTTTTTPSGTSSGPYEVATPGSSLKVSLTEATLRCWRRHPLLSEGWQICSCK